MNDNCSVGNISDNLEGLEGISEGAASTGNLSVTSSCDDLDKAANEIETDPMFDNGSVSGRGKKKNFRSMFQIESIDFSTFIQQHQICQDETRHRLILVWIVVIDERLVQIMLQRTTVPSVINRLQRTPIRIRSIVQRNADQFYRSPCKSRSVRMCLTNSISSIYHNNVQLLKQVGNEFVHRSETFSFSSR